MSLVERVDSFLAEMSARKVMKVLKKRGCKTLRQKGSHVQVQCPPDGRQSTVPSHGSKDIKKGTLSAIEKSLGIDIDGDGKPKESLDESVTFSKAKRGRPGEPTTIEIYLDGEDVGVIEGEFEDRGTGMRMKWWLMGYQVTIWDLKEDAWVERKDEESSSRKALTRAKKVAEKLVQKLPDDARAR